MLCTQIIQQHQYFCFWKIGKYFCQAPSFGHYIFKGLFRRHSVSSTLGNIDLSGSTENKH